MDRAERLAALNESHAAASEKDAAVERASEIEPETAAAAPDEDKVDLDNPVTQEEILNPEGTDVELSYGTVRLYPPSAMVRRMAYAFCQEIIADAADTQPTTVQVFSMRVLSKIMATAAPQMRLFRMTASMCGKPGKIDDKTALSLSTEIAEKATPDDVAILFEQLSIGAGFRLGPVPAKK